MLFNTRLARQTTIIVALSVVVVCCCVWCMLVNAVVERTAFASAASSPLCAWPCVVAAVLDACQRWVPGCESESVERGKGTAIVGTRSSVNTHESTYALGSALPPSPLASAAAAWSLCPATAGALVVGIVCCATNEAHRDTIQAKLCAQRVDQEPAHKQRRGAASDGTPGVTTIDVATCGGLAP